MRFLILNKMGGASLSEMMVLYLYTNIHVVMPQQRYDPTSAPPSDTRTSQAKIM